MKKSIITILSTAALFLLNAQVSFKADKKELYTGERLKIELQLNYPANAIVDSSFYKTEQAGGFEKVADTLLSRKNSGGKISEKRIFTYSAFADSGDHAFALPPFRYVSNSQPAELLSDSVTITVLPLLTGQGPAYADSLIKKVANPKDSSQMILPVKNIVKYQLSAKEKWVIFWSLCGILIVALLISFMLRKKKNKTVPVVETVVKKDPAHVIALRELAALKEAKLPQKGEFKEFSIRLSLIVREYLENRFEFNAAELTSHELKLESRKYLEETAVSESLDKLLDDTDLIKFAKFLPAAEDLDHYFEQSLKIIEHTKNDNNSKM